MMEADAFDVVRTESRSEDYDYLVQLNRSALSAVGGVSEGDLVRIRAVRGPLETAVLANVQVRDDLGNSEAGVDFSLRYALATPARQDLAHSDADRCGRVVIEKADRPRRSVRQWTFDSLLGIRPEICRVRMAVHPDLENRICRISGNTMELIGVEKGDKIVLESPYGRVTGIKAFPIDEESQERKAKQREQDPDRYVDCYERLELNRIRRTEVDIPEVYLDHDVRTRLALRGAEHEGVCQPVRIYRDSYGQFVERSNELVAPLAIVLVGGGLEASGALRFLLFGGATLLAVLVLVFQSRRALR
jgi:hypothetical protein